MRSRFAGWRSALYPMLSATFALALAAIVISASGYDVRAALTALWSGATGFRSGPPRSINDFPVHVAIWSGRWSRFAFAQSVARATPLLLAGLAVAVALRAGLFNIGGQGQLLVGGLAAAVAGARLAGPANGSTFIPHVTTALACGTLAGAVWAGIAGLLKATRAAHEVLTTIMLNYVAANVASYLVVHGLKDPRSVSMAPQTALMSPSTWLPPLVRGSNLTAGIAIALVAAALVSFVVRRTSLGFEIRTVGSGIDAARAAGIPVGRVTVTAMAISGALAGLAGAIEVAGVHHRYVQGVEGTFGFDAIAVALLGALHPIGIAISALFFGMLQNGSNAMQAQTGVPSDVAIIVQAVVVILAGARAFGSRRIAAPKVVETKDDD